MKRLIIKGAREHNLKNIDLDLPRDKFIVISGLSGSGKSSLAFDTIFAEGQRRYVESLSAYARQFLGRMDKPDVDYIEGLSPAISIEQKTTNRNPRSTVGTITEIWDYYRLLFARIGVPHDPKTGEEIKKQTIDEITDAILSYPENARIMVLAPVVRGKKGVHQKILEDARKAGFVRARVDGEVISLDESIELDKKRKHSIDIVVDRLKVTEENRKRIVESVETALETASGVVTILHDASGSSVERSFSQHYAYSDSNLTFPELEPRLFSFNSPFGACPACSGLGTTREFDPELIMPNPELSYEEGGLLPYKPTSNWNRALFEGLAEHLDFDLNTPLGELPEGVLKALFYGTREPVAVTYINRDNSGRYEYTKQFDGIIADLNRRYKESPSSGIREWLEGFMRERICTECQGKRLRPEALHVLIEKRNIHELSSMSVNDALRFFNKLTLSDTERQIAGEILKEIVARLTFMMSVGLDYLSLDRNAGTLSGGEAQRIRLATQIGSQLTGVLYILDEPTIGLHQRDNERLLNTLFHLRDIGNTLVVVEHDEQTLRDADYIVDLGPGAGVHGGQVVAQGPPEEVMEREESLTGQYLAGKLTMPVPEQRRRGNGNYLSISGCREHNLKGITASIPLGTLSVITGVSGSGKSTLLSDLIYPALVNRVTRGHEEEGAYDTITGTEHIDKVINIDQSPIGRTPRSNPATYANLFTPIRELFAGLPEAKARGYKPGRFSFNVKGGRCEQCQGAGTLKIEMHFLPDVYVTCDVCHGKRFTRETLDIRYKGKNIYEVLEMSVEEAAEFFQNIPQIKRRLDTLMAVGLDYVKLGQSALTLSGGEAQRVKLSLELSKRSTGNTFYILDEPTTGLHFADVKKLMEVLAVLADKGNTVVLIEHNLDVIKQADYLIDLGPEGGDRGGEIVVTGTPEEVASFDGSHTGRFLRPALGIPPREEATA
ncbi:MAG: excinuclease ABC subunit UvrA [Spirochaetaceae bacterium]